MLSQPRTSRDARPITEMAVRLGKTRDMRADENRIIDPGTTRGPFPNAFNAVAATTSGVTVPGAAFRDADARLGVLTAPATQVSTSTPVARSSPHNDSANTASNALVPA